MPSIATQTKAFESAKEAQAIVPAPAETSKPTATIPEYPVRANSYLRTPLPAASVQQPDMQRGWHAGTSPQSRISPLPLLSNPIVGASAASQAKIIVDKAIAAIPPATPAVSVTDGLIHGDAIWETDSAYVMLRDDFTFMTGSSATARAGALSWANSQNSGSERSTVQAGLGIQHLGEYAWTNSTTSNAPSPSNGIGNIAVDIVTSGNDMNAMTLALLAYPSWKATFIWRFHRVDDEPFAGNSPSPFPLLKKSVYIGLANNILRPVNGWSRPQIFIGARFDTDPGAAFALTNAANAVSGQTTYTGTITGGGGSAFLGAVFVITGFTIGANNGTFYCASSTATTLVLQNAGGSVEAHAGTATFPAISDSTIKFEAVENTMFAGQIGRNNVQGTVVDTGLAPTEDVYYRLDMLCTTAGQVIMSINGATTTTFTIPKMTISTGTGAANANFVAKNGQAQMDWGTDPTGTLDINGPFGPGEPILVAGTGGLLDANWTVNNVGNSGQSKTRVIHFKYTGVNVADTSAAFNVTGYPSLIPIFMFGNDSVAAPATDSRICVDYFSFVWNPGVGGGTGTPVSTKSRYF
jgi:hypothetical protein